MISENEDFSDITELLRNDEVNEWHEKQNNYKTNKSWNLPFLNSKVKHLNQIMFLAF